MSQSVSFTLLAMLPSDRQLFATLPFISTWYFGTGCGDAHSCPVSACGALQTAREAAPTTAEQVVA